MKSRTTLFRKVIACFSAFILSVLKRWQNLVVPKYPPENWEIHILFMALLQTGYLALSKSLLSASHIPHSSVFKLLGEKYI